MNKMTRATFTLSLLALVLLDVGSTRTEYALDTGTAHEDRATPQPENVSSEVTQVNDMETVSGIVEIDPFNLTVAHGDEFSLWCQVSGVLYSEITWFLGEDEITEDRAITVKSNKTGSRLTVLHASSATSGVYTCEVEASGDVFTATTTVTVQEPLSLVVRCAEEDQDFCHNGGTCLHNRGNDVDLFCSCTADYTGKNCQYRDLGFDLFAPSTAATDMKAPLFGVAAGIVVVVVVVAVCLVRHYRSKYLKEVQKNKHRDQEEGKKEFYDEDNHNVEMTPILKPKASASFPNGAGHPTST